MKKDIETEILKKIKNDKIEPIPRWHFLVKYYSSLSLLAWLIVLWSITFGIIFFYLYNTDWDIYNYSWKNILYFSVTIIPYIWFVCLVLLIILAYFTIRHTPKWYKYKSSVIFFWILLSFIIFWLVVYASWISNNVEKKLSDISPIYSSHAEIHIRHMWMHPKQGLLAWLIMESNNNELIINDLNWEKWNIDIKDAIWKGNAKNITWEGVKIIWKYVSPNKLIANEIRPWVWIKCNMMCDWMNWYGKWMMKKNNMMK